MIKRDFNFSRSRQTNASTGMHAEEYFNISMGDSVKIFLFNGIPIFCTFARHEILSSNLNENC